MIAVLLVAKRDVPIARIAVVESAEQSVRERELLAPALPLRGAGSSRNGLPSSGPNASHAMA
jgi:hypothetical protein